MRNPNELRKFFSFQINECEAVKEYLEEMALKGWKLTRTSKNIKTFFYFEKIEPQKLHYAVEFFAKASASDNTPSYYTKEFIEYCEKAGWDFICNVGQVNIFISNVANPVAIETDEELKFKTVRKEIFKRITSLLTFIPVLLIISSTRFLVFEPLVTDYRYLSDFLLCVILFVFSFFTSIGYIIWMIKQKRRLKNDEPIKYISQKQFKAKLISRIIFSVALMMLFPLKPPFFLFSKYSPLTVIAITALFYIPGILLLFFVSKKFNLGKVGVVVLGAAIYFALIAGTAITVMVCATPTEWPSPYMASSKSTFLASHDEYKIELGHEDEKVERTYHDSKENYEAIYNENSEKARGHGSKLFYWSKSAQYCYFTVFKSDYDFIMDQYLYSRKYLLYNKNYKEISLPEWGAKEAFTVNGTKKTYVVYEDYVVSFNSECPFTKEIIEQILQERENK